MESALRNSRFSQSFSFSFWPRSGTLYRELNLPSPSALSTINNGEDCFLFFLELSSINPLVLGSHQSVLILVCGLCYFFPERRWSWTVVVDFIDINKVNGSFSPRLFRRCVMKRIMNQVYKLAARIVLVDFDFSADLETD